MAGGIFATGEPRRHLLLNCLETTIAPNGRASYSLVKGVTNSKEKYI